MYGASGPARYGAGLVFMSSLPQLSSVLPHHAPGMLSGALGSITSAESLAYTRHPTCIWRRLLRHWRPRTFKPVWAEAVVNNNDPAARQASTAERSSRVKPALEDSLRPWLGTVLRSIPLLG